MIIEVCLAKEDIAAEDMDVSPESEAHRDRVGVDGIVVGVAG